MVEGIVEFKTIVGAMVSKLVNKTRQKINIFYIHFLSTIINRNFKMIINFV